MKRRQDIIQAVILALFLVLAYLIGNAIIKGILLLLFSTVLILNIISKLKTKKDKVKDRVFLGILLFLVSVLAIASIYVMAAAIVETF